MIRKVGAAVLDGDGRLLVVRKRGRDVFILPGGKPEPGETLEQTLNRELEEELGVRAAEAEALMSVADTAAFEDVPLSMEVFSVVLDGVPTPSREIAEMAYVPPDWRTSGLRLASGITRHVLPHLFPDLASAPLDVELGRRPVAVLFSGGRDSTAVAVGLHDAGHPLHLLSFQSGLGVDNGLYPLRLAEFVRLWDPSAVVSRQLPISGLARQICFRDLVDDVMTDGRQLILLGEALAMVTRGIEYCRDHGISDLALGATGYQSNFPEQQPGALKRFTALCATYGVTLLTPGVQWDSESEVKDRLRLSGFSTKSLEPATVLSDLDDNPPPDAVNRYLDRKIAWSKEYLDVRVRRSRVGRPA